MLRAKATRPPPPATLRRRFALELEAQQWSMDRPGFADGVRALTTSCSSGRADVHAALSDLQEALATWHATSPPTSERRPSRSRRRRGQPGRGLPSATAGC